MEIFERLWVFRELVSPFLDILILSFLFYHLYKIVAETKVIQLARGAFFIALLYAVAFFLSLDTLLWIMNSLATVFVIIIAIVFQPELRAIFTQIGRGGWFKSPSLASKPQLDSVVTAAEVLSGRRRGMLIVFPRKVGIKNVIDTGTRLNAEISNTLLLTLFGHDTPLHDGAAIAQSGKIVAAGCFLPLSEQVDIKRSFGTRHRAALGMAEETDAVVLIVSEETGALSLAYEANLYYDISPREIARSLNALLNYREDFEEQEEEAVHAE